MNCAGHQSRPQRRDGPRVSRSAISFILSGTKHASGKATRTGRPVRGVHGARADGNRAARNKGYHWGGRTHNKLLRHKSHKIATGVPIELTRNPQLAVSENNTDVKPVLVPEMFIEPGV
jgi:hypothetical protein